MTALTRRYSDLSLASALLAAGATLSGTERTPNGKTVFVLSSPDLDAMERAHFSGTLTVVSRVMADHRHGLMKLIALNRADDSPWVYPGDVSPEDTP